MRHGDVEGEAGEGILRQDPGGRGWSIPRLFGSRWPGAEGGGVEHFGPGGGAEVVVAGVRVWGGGGDDELLH